MFTFRKIFLLFFLLNGLYAGAQKADIIREYIDRYRDLAMAEMQRTGVPAAITLAQGIHESGAGNSRLALSSNNHFGIKCKSNWTGESVRHDDDEKAECFRKYPAVEDSYRDHSDFLKNGSRYAFLFSLDPADYAGWAHGLKKAGYATNPRYPQVLIKLVEDYGLQQYTLLAMGRSTDEILPPVVTVTQSEPATAPVNAPVSKSSAYPKGVFTINGLRVLYAEPGISYLSIARKYRVDYARLFEYNEIPVSEATESAQLVFLQRKKKTASRDWHQVAGDETLHAIAQHYGIRLQSLRELNGLTGKKEPAVGQKLRLRGASASAAGKSPSRKSGATAIFRKKNKS